MPDLRDGARAADSDSEGGKKSRARRRDTALLGRRGAVGAGVAGCDVRYAARTAAASYRQPPSPDLVSVLAIDSRRSVVRLAFFSAHVDVVRQSQSEHVYLDRHGRRRGLRL